MKRRLAAIFAADVVGYSHLMVEDEAAALEALRTHRHEVLDPTIAAHDGRIVKLMGEGTLVEFPCATGAIEAALEIQRAIAASPDRIVPRIGVNVGDVIVEGDDIYGDGVNVAARLEALAPTGGICVSLLALESVGAALGAEFADAGAHRVKNIAGPIHVHRWPSGAGMGQGAELDFAGGRVASVAVMRFGDMTAKPVHRHLASGLHEDLTTALAKIDGLRLITAAATLAEDDAATRYGRKIGVAYLVRVSGERVGVTPQLIDCASDEAISAERLDGVLDDIFAFQDSVIDQISAALQMQLSDGEQAMVWRGEAGDAKAYEHFRGGRTS